MSSLPQELIDKIIDEVSQHGSTHDLRAWCLVQKRWVERSGSHLFKEVSLCNMNHARSRVTVIPPGAANRFQGWVKAIPPGRDGPCHHVRSLIYCQGAGWLGLKQLLNRSRTFHVVHGARKPLYPQPLTYWAAYIDFDAEGIWPRRSFYSDIGGQERYVDGEQPFDGPHPLPSPRDITLRPYSQYALGKEQTAPKPS